MDIPNKHEKSTKNQSITEWYIYGKCRAMGKNVACLYCHQVEAVEYIELLSMRYNDTNLVAQRVFFFNWDSPHYSRLNSHYNPWSYKKGSTKKIIGYKKSF